MPSKTYLWIEDREGKASYIFWETFMRHICPDVIVESKKNNSELVKSVKALTDKENRYMVVFDNSFDNVQIYREQKILKESVDSKDNVFLLDLICFEYTLLEFDKLIEWIYAVDDEFLEKRAGVIAAREKLVEMLKSGDLNYKGIQEVIDYDNKIHNHNVEQLSAKLLFDLTRNTGFEITKGKIGECWTNSCCEWEDRQDDDVCGLDKIRLSIEDKMKSIYMGTALHRVLAETGLEISL